MRKYITILLLALSAQLLTGCYKTFVSSVDLGVNDKRINITWAQAQSQLDFTYPVYSTTDWTIRIIAGGDWLTLDRDGGSGRQYVHCTASANTTGRPRAVKLEIAGAGKTIITYIVTSSADIKSSDLDDADLDNYLQ